jgi:hypothetical protein
LIDTNIDDILGVEPQSQSTADMSPQPSMVGSISPKVAKLFRARTAEPSLQDQYTFYKDELLKKTS